MRWLSHGMVLNEASYAAYAISSIYDLVDHIFLAHGSTPYSYWASPYGMSTDNTEAVIRGIPDPVGKIHLYNVGHMPSKRALRSASFAMLREIGKPRPGDGVFVLDLDEIWPSEDLQLADERFSADPTLQYLHCDLIQLRGDFEHYRDMDAGEGCQEHNLYNEQDRKGEIICRNNITIRQGRTAERLFRWQPGLRYISHVCVSDSYGRYLYQDPAFLDGRECDFSIKFWHYNYLKPFPDVFCKFAYFAQQDGGKKRNDEEMVARALNEGYIKYLFTGTHPKGDWAVSPLPAHLHHPAIMDSHPLRHKTEKEIADPTGEWLVPGAPDVPGYMGQVMAMLKEGSKHVGPDMSKLVIS